MLIKQDLIEQSGRLQRDIMLLLVDIVDAPEDTGHYIRHINEMIVNRFKTLEDNLNLNMFDEQHLANHCQFIQDDIDCILDGLDDNFIANVCQVVIDRFNILKTKFLIPTSA